MNPRANQLHHLARDYVLDGLGKGNFDVIPYSEDVTLRAPLCPGGSCVPLTGRSNLREQWWAPLPQLVAGVEVIDTYVNRDLTAVTVEFLCHIRQPPCTLRIIDRFKVNEAGLNALPFGGCKQSGWGRELGKDALEHYTETKSVVTAL